MIIHGHAQRGENFVWFNNTFLAEVIQGDTLPSCFSSYFVKCPFFSLFGAMFFVFCYAFLLVISLFKMAPKHRAVVLFSIP